MKQLCGGSLMDLYVGLICLCIIHWSSGQTTMPWKQCNTSMRQVYRQVSYSEVVYVKCKLWGWWRCTKYRRRTKTENRYMTVNDCDVNTSTSPNFTFLTNVTNTSTSFAVGDDNATMALSDIVGDPGPGWYVPVLVVCSLILISIVIVAVICFRRRKRRKKNNQRDTTQGQADLYVEPEVIRERKRAGISQDQHNGTPDQSHSGINEFELTNRSTPIAQKADDDDLTDIEPTYEVGMEDDKVLVKDELPVQDTNAETYMNQRFEPAINYDHVILESQDDTCTDDVYGNEAMTSESNPDDYDHIRKVHITG